MIIFHIVFKSLRQHLVSTLVSATAIALAGGLLMAVWVMREEASRTFTSVSGGFDAVLGVRSSKLQLVLNAIFHLEDSPGNITAADAETLMKNPNIELALPIAVGDNYRGYRLVGTTQDLFGRVEYAAGKTYRVAAPGRPFAMGEKEAVVGSFAAKQLGLGVGGTFHPFHGLIYDESKQHAETFVVTGVLEPTGTPADRVIWIPLEGLQQMSGHDVRAATDISALLIKLKGSNPMAGFQLDMLLNKRGNKFTFAWPIGAILGQLFSKIAWFDRMMTFVAYLVVVVATASILTSIYNSMNERRREIAILRALGAKRITVFGAIVTESAAIAAIGMVFAFVIYGAVVMIASSIIRAQTGVVIDPLEVHPVMVAAPAGIIALAAFCGVFPALKAYRTDVAGSISPHVLTNVLTTMKRYHFFRRLAAGVCLGFAMFATGAHAFAAEVDLTPRKAVVGGTELFVLGFDQLSSFDYMLVDAGTGATPEEIAEHMKKDPVPAWVRTYDKQRVLLTGYLMPLQVENGRAKKFVMMRDVNTCCYGAVPRMNDYLVVTMAGEGVEPVQDVPVELIGVFHIEQRYEDGYVVSLFKMDGEKFLGPKK